MLKATFFTLLLTLISANVLSQNNGQIEWAWTGTYGSPINNSIANHLVVDDDKNMYVAGVFVDTLVVQTDTIYGHPTNDRVFVAKFDSLGVVQWITRIDWGYYVNQIQLDSDGDLHVLCNAGVLIVYESQTGQALTYYSVPESISDYQTTTPYGATIDFLIDTSDNIYFLQRFDDMNTTWNSFSHVSVFSSPNDTLDTLIWEDYIELGVMFSAHPAGFSIDSNNNVYLSGRTDFASLSLVGTDVVTTQGGGSEMFALKYNNLGEVQWLSKHNHNFAGVSTSSINMVDSSMYLAGNYNSTEVWYGDTLTVDTTNSRQIFLMKFDTDGNHQWTNTYPLATKTLKNYPGASWGAYATDLQISDSGYVYFKGSFTGTIIFNNDTLVEDTNTVILNTIADDVFIAKLDQNGNAIWGKYGGNQGGQGLETGDFYVDPATDLMFLVGYYASPNYLNKSMLPDSVITNMFVGREGTPASTVSVEQITLEKGQLLVYPNPSSGQFTVSLPPNSDALNYSIIDLQGKIIQQDTLTNSKALIDLSDEVDGVYFFRTNYGAVKMMKQ